jgi:tetratricopeptide (TPR) repeat protein
MLRNQRINVFRALASIAALGALSLSLRASDLSQAEQLYERTDYQASLALLDKSSGDSATLFLIGRDYFMLGDFKNSTQYLQKASLSDLKSSQYVDWLGRAYGRRAETSNALMAPGLASKARQAFEHSVALDPKNSEALGDLFDFYLEAPGFLGGGYDRAAKVADQISSLDPAEGFFLKARLAQKRKEFQTAEQQLRQAVAVAPQAIGHVIALAKFLANQGRIQESDALFLQAQTAHPDAATIWFARADLLIKQRRSLEEAKTLLQKYLHAPTTVDDPPKQAAAQLLKQVAAE